MRSLMSRYHPWIMQAVGGLIAVVVFAIGAVIIYFAVLNNLTEAAIPAPLAPPASGQPQQGSSSPNGSTTGTKGGAPKSGGTTASAATWAAVHTIFASNCAPCHIGANLAGLNLDTYASAMKGGSVAGGGVVDGAVIKPGNAAGSYLYQAVNGTQTKGARMPFGRAPLPQSDIQTIYNWIQSGAKQ